MKILFKNIGLVGEKGLVRRDLFLDDGEVLEAMDSPDLEVDGSGKYLLPGLVDAHVHFREPGHAYKEDWDHAGKAALIGGITTVLDMPNNSPLISTRSALNDKKKLIEGRSYVNYGLHFSAESNFDELEKVEDIIAFKVYMGRSTGDVFADEASIRRIFEIAKERGIPVIVHAEDEERIKARMKKFEGRNDLVTHSLIRDRESARMATEKAILLREEIGNKLHIAHVSTKNEIELIRRHKCAELTCEVAPHHLYFGIEDISEFHIGQLDENTCQSSSDSDGGRSIFDSRLKMNPPLRAEDDLLALWDAIRDGTVDMVASDHAPHTLEEKMCVHWDAPAGVPGVGFLLPLLLNEVSGKMLDFSDILRLLHENPIKIFSLPDSGKDWVLVDMNKEQIVSRGIIHSKCGWSPYEGYKLKGWPIMTIVNGELVAKDGKVVGGHAGRFIARR